MRTSREEGERARTRLVDELSRSIGAALADRQLESSRSGMPSHTSSSEHGVAMLAANELDRFRALSRHPGYHKVGTGLKETNTTFLNALCDVTRVGSPCK